MSASFLALRGVYLHAKNINNAISTSIRHANMKNSDARWSEARQLAGQTSCCLEPGCMRPQDQ